MDLANFLIQLLNSVQYGLLLFMLAAGLTLIFGIMGVVNLAHGSFYMLGAYLAWSLSSRFGNLPLAIAAGAVIAVAFGLVLERLLFRHFSNERMAAITEVFRKMLEVETPEEVDAAVANYRAATASA